MQEQHDTQVSIAALHTEMRKAIELAGTDRSHVETRRMINAVEQRLTEASMLLSLAIGTNVPITLQVQPVLRAAMEADKHARRVLNTDIDITGLSQEKQDEMMQMMELAEEGYAQWRALSALSLMHLSEVFRIVDKATHVAGR